MWRTISRVILGFVHRKVATVLTCPTHLRRVPVDHDIVLSPSIYRISLRRLSKTSGSPSSLRFTTLNSIFAIYRRVLPHEHPTPHLRRHTYKISYCRRSLSPIICRPFYCADTSRLLRRSPPQPHRNQVALRPRRILLHSHPSVVLSLRSIATRVQDSRLGP